MRIFSDAGGWFLDNQFQNVIGAGSSRVTSPTRPGPASTAPQARPRSPAGTSRMARTGASRTSPSGTGSPSSGPAAWASLGSLWSVRNVFTIPTTPVIPDVNSNGSSDSNVGLGTDFYAYPQARTFSSVSRPPGNRHHPPWENSRCVIRCPRLPAHRVAGGLRLALGQESSDQLPTETPLPTRGAPCRPRGCVRRLAGNRGRGVLLRRGVRRLRRTFPRTSGDVRHFRAVRRCGRERVPLQQLDRGRIWQAIYDALNRVNLILEKVPA